MPVELAWSAIFSEAREVVVEQVLLRDTNLPVESGDSRQSDFVAWGLRGFSRPVCGDATTVSPLHHDGTPPTLNPDIVRSSLTRALAHLFPRLWR